MNILMIRKLLLIAFSIVWHPVFAASFDCDKARGTVEKKICTDPILSALDDELLFSYLNTLDDADKPNVVKSDQRTWLQLTRNKCESSKCIENAYRQRTSDLKKYSRSTWVEFEDDEMGIRFLYPSNKIVRSDKKEKRITVYSYPGNSNNHVIEFEVGSGNLEIAARTTDVFVRKNGKWISNIGTSSDVAAERISGNGWKGIKAVVSCGVIDEESGIHATGECLWAIISNGSRHIVAHTQGAVEINDRLLKTLSSLSFIPSGK